MAITRYGSLDTGHSKCKTLCWKNKCGNIVSVCISYLSSCLFNADKKFTIRKANRRQKHYAAQRHKFLINIRDSTLHSCSVLPSDLFPYGLLTKIVRVFLISTMHVTRSIHLILLELHTCHIIFFRMIIILTLLHGSGHSLKSL